MNNIINDFNQKLYESNFDADSKHYAKNQAFTFVPSEGSWMLDVHKGDTFDISSLHASQSEYKSDYLKLLTYFAEQLAPRTFKSYHSTLKQVKYPDNLNEFRQLFPRLPNWVQRKLKSIYSSAIELNCEQLIKFASFIDELGVGKVISKYLDPEKGAYTDKENASISHAFRVITDRFIIAYKTDRVHNATEINQLGTLVALHLMRGILRRPTQLMKLKWSDFRPVGVRFNQTIQTPELSDTDALHVRVFKGKRGDFRGYAEKRSLRLEPELSSLVVLYHHHYLQTLTKVLNKQGLTLNTSELVDIRNQLPVFADLSLFSKKFETKASLFKSLSMRSKSFHKAEDSLLASLKGFTKVHFSSYLQSERIDSAKLTVGNNRIRHTALTNATRKGSLGPELAQLTGVTLDAVKHYVDLTNEARSEIDNSLSNNNILNEFGRIAIAELQSKPGYIQLNEFDEEFAVITKPYDCSSCKSSLGKPLSCYPCQNFKPLAEANHQYYLDKAERKLELNSASNANPLSTRKLREIVLYIRATIKACDTWKLKKVGDNR